MPSPPSTKGAKASKPTPKSKPTARPKPKPKPTTKPKAKRALEDAGADKPAKRTVLDMLLDQQRSEAPGVDRSKPSEKGKERALD